ASGNVLAMYENDTLKSQPIYGSSRLGMYTGGNGAGARNLGNKHYELTNHLGNVLAVVTDNIHMKNDSTTATIVSASDYYPFGSTMPGRTFNAIDYRYGFNAKEKDQRGEFGKTHYDYGFRIYNPEIGKFLSVDPLTASYPMLTPYQFANNTPIEAIDLDGLEALQVTYGEGGMTFYAPSEYSSSPRYVPMPVQTEVHQPEIGPPPVNWAGHVENYLAGDDLPPFLSGSGILMYNIFDQAYVLGTKTAYDFKIGSGPKHLNNLGVTRDDLILSGVGTYSLLFTALPGMNFGKSTVSNGANLVDDAVRTPKLKSLQSTFDDLAETHLLPKYRKLDPNLKAGYTGSFKTGKVGNPNKSTFGDPIDLNSFDVDFWIESDELYKKFGSNVRADVEFRKILSETPGFEGLKPNKQGFSIKFKPSN
ncbi:MAG: hypothetical protein MI975_22945, partial [Cytophagales bacterium]|nr:hypothetical protein [Cytophagales bacterium]